MNKLRECPFCGSKADYADVPESIPTCTNIKCKMSFGLKMSYDEWNTRAIDPRLKEAVTKIDSHRFGADGWENYEYRLGIEKALDILRKHFPELKEVE